MEAEETCHTSWRSVTRNAHNAFISDICTQQPGVTEPYSKHTSDMQLTVVHSDASIYLYAR
jgi:hypothetical protein